MVNGDFSEGELDNNRMFLAHLDIMSELLSNIIERGQDLKERVEDLGCIITDCLDPMSKEESEQYKNTADAIRKYLRHLF